MKAGAHVEVVYAPRCRSALTKSVRNDVVTKWALGIDTEPVKWCVVT